MSSSTTHHLGTHYHFLGVHESVSDEVLQLAKTAAIKRHSKDVGKEAAIKEAAINLAFDTIMKSRKDTGPLRWLARERAGREKQEVRLQERIKEHNSYVVALREDEKQQVAIEEKRAAAQAEALKARVKEEEKESKEEKERDQAAAEHTRSWWELAAHKPLVSTFVETLWKEKDAALICDRRRQAHATSQRHHVERETLLRRHVGEATAENEAYKTAHDIAQATYKKAAAVGDRPALEGYALDHMRWQAARRRQCGGGVDPCVAVRLARDRQEDRLYAFFSEHNFSRSELRGLILTLETEAATAMAAAATTATAAVTRGGAGGGGGGGTVGRGPTGIAKLARDMTTRTELQQTLAKNYSLLELNEPVRAILRDRDVHTRDLWFALMDEPEHRRTAVV